MYLIILVFLLSNELVHSEMTGFIMGGIKAKIIKYPHSVLLHIYSKTKFVCGGSIINQNIVLTAAHCLEDYKRRPDDSVVLKCGNARADLMGGTKMKDYVMHENYDSLSMANDICLVSVMKPFKLNANVKRVAILRSTPADVKLGFVAGWGVNNKNRQMSKDLYSTAQTLQPSRVCRLLGRLPQGTFCAGSVKGSAYPEAGDSGSALIGLNFVQLGLVSFKATKYSLVVYTNVSYHYNWIRNTALQLYCQRKKTMQLIQLLLNVTNNNYTEV